MNEFRRSSIILSLALLIACGDDKTKGPDTGIRIDSGSTSTRLDMGVTFSDSGPTLDAQSNLDAAIPSDAGSSNLDTGIAPLDTGIMFADAQTTDAMSPSDIGTLDVGVLDSGQGMDSGSPLDTGAMDAGMSDSGVLVGTQSGELVITEVMGNTSGLEWIELKNTSSQIVDLSLYALELGSRGGVSVGFYHRTNSSGTSTTPLELAPQQLAYFVLNPVDANTIPNDAHVYGTPGQFGGNGFSDTGDRLTLKTNNQVVDTVDMTNIATGSDRNISDTQFPIIENQTVQLSSHLSGAIGANANDFAAVWCAPIWRGSTPGQTNHDCNWFVISEVLYDYDSISSGGDNGFEFIEIAGAAGAYLQDLQVSSIQGSSTGAGTVIDSDTITGIRMPGNGLYVLADESSSGQTEVANADQVVDLQFQNGPDAIQLLRVTASSGTTYFDSFGYGNLTPNLTDMAHMQPAYEGSTVPDLSTRVRPLTWARDINQTDTQNNAADFSFDPSPTPGEPNVASELRLISVDPAIAMASDTATVSFIGEDFTDYMNFELGGVSVNASDCQDISAQEVRCVLSASSTVAMAPFQQTIQISTRPEHGQSVEVVDGFTWAVNVNDTNSPEEIDYCNIQFPQAITIATSSVTQLIYGRIYEGGITDVTNGHSNQVYAQLGYGPVNSDPRTSNGWRWEYAIFNVEYGNNDEYQGVLTAPAPGDYNYAFRFSVDGGYSWTVCDADGAGSDPNLDYSPGQLGTLTVTP